MRKQSEQPAPAAPASTAPGGAATQKLIAARCGVSQMTVSRVLRGDASISEETATNVLTAAREMGYDPMAHDEARRLVLRRSGRKVVNYLVAMVLPQEGLQHTYYASMLQGAWQMLTNAGYSVLLVNLPSLDSFTTKDLPSSFRRGDVDGILVFCADDRIRTFFEGLQSLAGPMPQQVFLIQGPLDATVVHPDDRHGAYAATHHLLTLGHRHILQFTHPEYRPMTGHSFDRRIQGIQRAYLEFDLDYRKHVHLMTYPSGWLVPVNRVADAQESVKSAIRAYKQMQRFIRYLKEHPQITAIMGANDATAQHAWYTLARAGYTLPLEYSIVGFDDTDPLPDAEGNNMLTTVRLPLAEVGRSAARMLVRLLTDGQDDSGLTVLSSELVIRGSTTTPLARKKAE